MDCLRPCRDRATYHHATDWVAVLGWSVAGALARVQRVGQIGGLERPFGLDAEIEMATSKLAA